jgi:UDP-galactopyranose mutase
MKKYDYIIVGAGPFGCVFAREMKNRGKTVLILDKRNHIAGNTYTEKKEGINIHKYGAHIFHTSDKKIWNYVNKYSEFNNYINSPIANFKGDLFNLPFNMNTFYKLWNVKTPEEAKQKIKEQTKKYESITNPKNLEEQALKLVGDDIYFKLIKGYTEKQWGKKANELPSFIIKRLPLRYTFDNNYFNDTYQGIPVDGYTNLFQKIIGNDIEVKLNFDFFKNKKTIVDSAIKIVFTGKIDEFFEFKYGNLEYRSLKFENEFMNTENFQGNAVVNYTDKDVEYTRILEHKHFEFGKQKHTIITKEYPLKASKNNEPYYPINNDLNQSIFSKYKKLAEKENNVIFGGRLAEYRYYDMHQVIASALAKAKRELNA